MAPAYNLPLFIPDAKQNETVRTLWRQDTYGKRYMDGKVIDHLLNTEDEAVKLQRPFNRARIFTAPEHLREVRPEAYRPVIVVMGPYHIDRETAEIAECKIFAASQRKSAFQELQRLIYQDIAKFTEMYDRKLEVEPISLSLMLAMDASLLSDILSEYASRNYAKKVECHFDYVLPRRHFWTILRDLMLMENQIPIEVLKLEAKVGGRDRNLEDDVHRLIRYVYPFRRAGPHQYERPDFTKCHNLLEYLYLTCTHKGEKDETAERSDIQIPAATQLRGVGIIFKAVEGDLSVIKFIPSCCTLELPRVKMYSETESWFRNLMAYEQCRSEFSVHFSSYMRLMGCLIDTEEDVKLLAKEKVLVNLMGSNEAVANVWNKFGLNVELFLTKRDKAVMESINKHSNSRRKVLLAEIRNRYFSRPWSFISAIAAVVLILMTFLQTYFTMAAYFAQ